MLVRGHVDANISMTTCLPPLTTQLSGRVVVAVIAVVDEGLLRVAGGIIAALRRFLLGG